MPGVLDVLRPAPQALKVAAALALAAPLAAVMGMPIPLGLARTAAAVPDAVPWAWGHQWLRGRSWAPCSPTLPAIHLGFTAVVGCADGLYVVAALAFAR